MGSEPARVVSEYFSRMRSGDVSVVELFHDDATLVGLGTTRTGKDAIREFYQGVIERAGPTPRCAGPLLVNGPRVAAEIFIDLSLDPDEKVTDRYTDDDFQLLCSRSGPAGPGAS